RRLRRRGPAPADRERVLGDAVQAQRLGDVPLVDRGGDERGQAGFGGQQGERLRQVTGVEDDRAVGLGVVPVLPEVAGEAAGQHHVPGPAGGGGPTSATSSVKSRYPASGSRLACLPRQRLAAWRTADNGHQ